MKEEKLKWEWKKNTAKWRYKKLTSEAVEEYHQSKNARVKKAHEQQRQSIIDAGQGVAEVYQHIPDDSSPTTRAKEKSRAK